MAKQTDPVGGFTPIEVPVQNQTNLPGFQPFEVTPATPFVPGDESRPKRSRRSTTNAPSGENQEH